MIETLYRRLRTTKPEPGHKVYPYLLRGAAITRPNQVWAMDITYIPMARGFVYLAVVQSAGPQLLPSMCTTAQAGVASHRRFGVSSQSIASSAYCRN